jgi:2-dehydro-3-deoxygalactonokinase
VAIEFLTVPTGELFRLLCDHSVLVRDPSTPLEHHSHEFERGLAEAVRHGSVAVLHRLFQSRSLRIDQQLSAAGAASWTSGLLIGTDVGGSLPLFDAHPAGSPVHIVGAPGLTALYASALARYGRGGQRIDGDAAALAGLARVHAALAGG